MSYFSNGNYYLQSDLPGNWNNTNMGFPKAAVVTVKSHVDAIRSL